MTLREARRALDLLDRISYCEIKARSERITNTSRENWRGKRKAANEQLANLLRTYAGYREVRRPASYA